MANKAEDKKRSPSVKSILGGDILANDFFRRQTKLLILMMIFILFYIHNRYASQQQQIEIDKLKKELIDIKRSNVKNNIYKLNPCFFQLSIRRRIASNKMLPKGIVKRIR